MDEAAAKVIRRIYDLCIDGKGASQIARILWKDRVLTPSAHFHSIGIKSRHKPSADPYCWKDCTIDGILSRMEYLGCMVNFKHSKKSYKSKRSYPNSPDKWVIFEDAHPAIIEKAQWPATQFNALM